MPSDPIQTAALAVERYGNHPSSLLAILRQLQQSHHYVPRPAMEKVAERLAVPLAEVEAVTEFYSFLHSSPRGRYEIYFSNCIIDDMQGREALQRRLCERLKMTVGTTRTDGLVSVAETSCTGLCDQGPAILVNGHAIGSLTGEKIDRIADLVEQQICVEDWPAKWFRIEDRFERRDLLLSAAWQSGKALKSALRRGPEYVLEALSDSGLRGRGGAGFPTAKKWRFCREAAGEHYIVCNADEGEPGTFKDRVLLRHHADQLWEGMTLAAFVTDARRGFIYLRAEYAFLRAELEAAMRQRRRQGLLGRNICGLMDFHFDIEIVMGAGAYICGEESALLDSIEGRRGQPRNRPPYPVTAGLWGQPTVVNNVESFIAASLIVLNGGAWFAGVGTEKSKGTKLLSIGGDCRWPGIYEVPFGMTVTEILILCGAGETLGVQVGGPSGTFIGPGEYDRRIAFEDLGTGGSFMVFGKERDMLEIVRNFTGFFAHESCGFCTPCRVGTSILVHLLDKLRNGWGTAGDILELERLGRVVRQGSHCGLGHTAANPLLDTLERFPDRYQAPLQEIDFSPGFDLDGELETARRLTDRFSVADHLTQE
ncbi:MAG: NAD(P)H-dependent oxidoreductase subunit E [Methylohalobius sp. ZOD2]